MERIMKKTYVWLDLETTGLDPVRDAILEVGIVVTDRNYNELAAYERAVANDSWRLQAGKKVVDMHEKSGLAAEVDKSVTNLAVVEYEIKELLAPFADHTLVLSGNNVASFDRQFLVNHLPRINKLFHHRHVDVSSLYEDYELATGIDARKPNTGGHRALADARGSIELFVQFAGLRFK